MREVARLAREQAPLDRLAVLHTSNPEGADELKALLADVAPPQTLTLNITPTIGTHIGPGAVGVATVSKSWRQDENAIGA
jgi:fatty acid-binding protein DegV